MEPTTRDAHVRAQEFSQPSSEETGIGTKILNFVRSILSPNQAKQSIDRRRPIIGGVTHNYDDGKLTQVPPGSILKRLPREVNRPAATEQGESLILPQGERVRFAKMAETNKGEAPSTKEEAVDSGAAALKKERDFSQFQLGEVVTFHDEKKGMVLGIVGEDKIYLSGEPFYYRGRFEGIVDDRGNIKQVGSFFKFRTRQGTINGIIESGARIVSQERPQELLGIIKENGRQLRPGMPVIIEGQVIGTLDDQGYVFNSRKFVGLFGPEGKFIPVGGRVVTALGEDAGVLGSDGLIRHEKMEFPFKVSVEGEVEMVLPEFDDFEPIPSSPESRHLNFEERRGY